MLGRRSERITDLCEDCDFCLAAECEAGSLSLSLMRVDGLQQRGRHRTNLSRTAAPFHDPNEVVR